MKIRYFEDTDTLLIEFSQTAVADTRDLDENMVVDVDAHGNVCAITLEHASERTTVAGLSYERVAARILPSTYER